MAKNLVEQVVDPVVVANEDIIVYRAKLIREVSLLEERLKTKDALDFLNNETKIENRRLLIENAAHRKEMGQLLKLRTATLMDVEEGKQAFKLYEIEAEKKKKEASQWDDVIEEKRKEFGSIESNLRFRLQNIKSKEERQSEIDVEMKKSLDELEEVKREVAQMKRERETNKDALKRDVAARLNAQKKADELLEKTRAEARKAIDTANKHALEAQSNIDKAAKKAADIVASAEKYKTETTEEYQKRTDAVTARETEVTTRESWVQKKYNDLKKAKLELEEFYQRPIKHVVFVNNEVDILEKK